MDFGKHKWFFINIVGIVIFFIAVFFVFTSWINTYTLHGESVEVPNYTNLEFDAAQILAERDGLKIKISDTLCVACRSDTSVIFGITTITGDIEFMDK